MHRLVLTLFAVLAMATVARSQGIAARSTAETLRGLNGVHVVVEEMIPEIRSAGLTAAAVKSAVESRLISRGVPVLGLGALTMDPRGPALLIQLDFVSAPPVYFYSSQVQFFQNVTVNMGEHEIPSVASASTWQTSKVDRAGKFRIPTLSQVVVEQVDRFIDAYLTMNPPVVEEEPEEGDEGMDADSMRVEETTGEMGDPGLDPEQ